MRKNLIPFALMLASASVAQPASRDFRIGGEAFSEADILDARAQPDPTGQATILISLDTNAAARLAAITRAATGKAIKLELNGKTLIEPVVHEPIEGGSIQLSSPMSIPEAKALARLISGKEPLPESLEDE